MIRLEERPPRRVAVAPHDGGLETVDRTRRPLYQHLIQHEAVMGPSMLRFREDRLDVVVPAATGYTGGPGVRIEELPGGPYAVLDFEGPIHGLEDARQAVLRWPEANGRRAVGPLLQVHLYDEIEGITEQRFELPVESAPGPSL